MNTDLKVTQTGGLDRLMGVATQPGGALGSMRPLLVIGFCYFKRPLSLPQVKTLLQERFLSLPRFCSVLKATGKKGGSASCFQEVPVSSINIDELIQERNDIKTQADLDAFCTKMYATDLGLEHPRWRAFLFNNMTDGRSMLCFCIDHAIGDGPSLVGSLMRSMDGEANMPGVGSGKRKVKSPSCFARISACLGGTCYAFCGDQLPSDQPNKLKLKDHRNPGAIKAICQTTPIPMDKLKAVAEKYGGATLNDVLMIVVSLTLRQYFEKYEPKTLGNSKVRANFPISMRPPGVDVCSEKWFGNLFSQGQLKFPVHLDDPQDILRNIKAQIDKIKISPEPLIRQKLVNAMAASCLPVMAKKNIILDAYGGVTAMLSNIPGPNAEVKFAGQPIDDLAFYAMAPIGLYFGIVSYKGVFRAGICADAACEPDPQKLAEEWTIAWDRVYSKAMSAK